MTTEEPSPVDWPMRALKIVVLAMAIVLVCGGIAFVLLANEAASTQANADATRKANDELRAELQCRAVPTLEFDREFTELNALIAEGLSSVALGTFNDPQAFADGVQAQVDAVERTLDAREASFSDCTTEAQDATSGD